MIAVLWIVNIAISAFNAWVCGRSWNETRYVGGFAHIMNWMGAVMSACGFTWCYLIVLVVIGQVIPVTPEEGVEVVETMYWVTPEMAKTAFELGYLVIILPVIGSGTAITIESWAIFYRRRTFGSAALAGYNSFADVYNIYTAVRHAPGMIDNVGNFFTSDSGSSDSSDGRGKLIILLLVVAACCMGILTTYLIITSVARNRAVSLYHHYELQREAA